jgi:hypothetical protein
MRVNHTGEVCAQALYQGQALTARLPTTTWSGANSACANWTVDPACSTPPGMDYPLP